MHFVIVLINKDLFLVFSFVTVSFNKMNNGVHEREQGSVEVVIEGGRSLDI